MSTVDVYGVTRVDSLEDLPDEALRCAAHGHQWSDPPASPMRGWANVDAWELQFSCPCGRWKREVVDGGTGTKLVYAYGGGTMPYVRQERHTARQVWLARKRRRSIRAVRGTAAG